MDGPDRQCIEPLRPVFITHNEKNSWKKRQLPAAVPPGNAPAPPGKPPAPPGNPPGNPPGISSCCFFLSSSSCRGEKERKNEGKKDNRRALWNTDAQWWLLSTFKLNIPQTSANSATKQSSIPHLPCFFLCLPGSFTDQREENEQRTKMVNGKS